MLDTLMALFASPQLIRYACLDTATKNLGFCVRQLGSTELWEPRQISITCTAQGFVYHDLEEALIPEMTVRLLTDLKPILEKVDFIILEKTVHDNVIVKNQRGDWSKNKTISNTVILETSIRTALMTLPWAPPFVVKPCSWWRETTDVRARGVENYSVQAKYKADKQASIDAFVARFGKARYQALCRSQPENQAEDIIEAYWLGEAAAKRWDEIKLEVQTVNNYNAVLFPTVRIRIPAQERLGSWHELPTHEVETNKTRMQKYLSYIKERREKNNIKKITAARKKLAQGKLVPL